MYSLSRDCLYVKIMFVVLSVKFSGQKGTNPTACTRDHDFHNWVPAISIVKEPKTDQRAPLSKHVQLDSNAMTAVIHHSCKPEHKFIDRERLIDKIPGARLNSQLG